MTLTIGGYTPVNVSKAFDILRAQYIISKLIKENLNGTN